MRIINAELPGNKAGDSERKPISGNQGQVPDVPVGTQPPAFGSLQVPAQCGEGPVLVPFHQEGGAYSAPLPPPRVFEDFDGVGGSDF